MMEKFLSSQQREIARLRCTTWQAFNTLMMMINQILFVDPSLAHGD
jgi:hypothetical protein